MRPASARRRPSVSIGSVRSRTVAWPDPARARNLNAMSPVPPATSSRRWPGRGASQSIIASFQTRWMPIDMTSFITSYFEATELNTPRTRPAFSPSGTV